MLETEIQKLAESIITLTKTVATLSARIEGMSGAMVTEDTQGAFTKAAKTSRRTAVQVDGPADIEVKDNDNSPVQTVSISRDELQAKCMNIVRSDRTKRKLVENLITEFGGTLLRDVPDDKLSELAVKLEELS